MYYAKHQNNVFHSTHTPTLENVRCDQNNFCCKTSYIGTIGSRATAKDPPTMPWQLYSTKIENITIKITKTLALVSHMILHDLLNTRRASHIWRPKLRGQFFKRTQQSKRDQRVIWCVTWICVQVLHMSNHFQGNIKNILILKILKWNHLLLYLKRKLWNCIFLKPKAKQKLINTVVCCLHKRKNIKKNVKKKLGEGFLELICFIFYMSFKDNTSLRLCVCIICSLFFTYALLKAVIEKCLLNRCLFKFAKSLKNTCESIYCY